MTTVTVKGNDTGYIAPTCDQLRALRRIVLAVFPKLAEGAPTDEAAAEREFLCAFWAQGQFYRAEPNEREAFVSILDAANLKLAQQGCETVSSNTFIAACWASGDVPIRLANGRVGQLLSLGLLSDRQGTRCNPARWMSIAAGQANLLAPSAPRVGLVERAQAQNQTTFWAKGENSLRQIGATESLWSDINPRARAPRSSSISED
jgi:hypothetical protein